MSKKRKFYFRCIAVFADTHGLRFLLPVHNTDAGFIVLISARENTTSAVTIELDVQNIVGPINLDSGKTTSFSNSDITGKIYEMVCFDHK